MAVTIVAKVVVPPIAAPMHDAPAQDGFVITPSDSQTFAQQTQPICARAIYVGAAGNVQLITAGGTTLVFVGLLAGSVLPVTCQAVTSTNTTAGSLIGLI